MKKTNLKIAGMHCASCSLLIEKGLGSKMGIKNISVNLGSNSANISYDENMVNINDITKEINGLGYDVVQQLDDNIVNKYFKKFTLAAILSLPIMTTMFVDIGKIFVNNIFWIDFILLVFGVVVVFVAGWNFHVGFIKKLKKGQSNMDTLISVGTIVALSYSIYAFMQTYFGGNELHFYHFLEGAIFIITFISLGKYLELKSKGRASNAIQKLMQLQEKEAIVLKNGQEIKVSIDDIKIGDIVVVKAGDKISVDGIIVEGESSIDESMLTGESIPVSKGLGNDVFTGTIVQNGRLKIEVLKEQGETMLAKIVETVNDAQSSKPPIQHLADKISGIFVPIILLISVGAFIGWFLYTGDVQKSLLILVATIVIACPCAMGLATPMAIIVATGTGASRGILIKGGEVLEKSKNIDVVVFDKTGTLTEGKPHITDILPFGFTKQQVERIGMSLSIHSNHPLSKAFVNYTKDMGKEQIEIERFEEIGGQGLRGYCKMHKVELLFGNKKLLEQHDVSMSLDILKKIDDLSLQGKTPNLLVHTGNIIAIVAFMDIPKKDSIKGIEALKQMGIKTVMISGDNKNTVKAVAEQIHIDEFYGEIHPKEKSEIVKKIQSENNRVAFVGDGINDSPALAQSDLGIAIGQGSDIAIETADIVLVHGNPYKVVEAIKLARKTYKIIKQNLFWAFAYNAILVPVAAFGGLLPIFASLAMSMSSVSVVLNSLRLKKLRK